MPKKHIKNIWLVDKYAMPPKYESRLRTIKSAHYLQLSGYNVTILGCNIMHNMNLNLIEDDSLYIERQYDDLHLVHVRSLSYRESAGIRRMLSEILFYYNLVRMMKKMSKAGLIVVTTNTLISNPVLGFAHKNGVRYVKELLDIWPDIFVDLGLISVENPIMKCLQHRAKKNYIRSDAVVFSLADCFDYIRAKGQDIESGGPVDMKKTYYINSGMDLKGFDSWRIKYTIDDEGLKSDKKRVICSGNIQLVNNVGQLVRAAEKMRDLEDTVFLIYGDGDDRGVLIRYCAGHNLSNVKFRAKWVDPKYIPFVPSKSYLNTLNYISSEFAEYGISSSKMFQYMASGRPIVCDISLPQCPITGSKIGIAREVKDENDYAVTIRSLLEPPTKEYNTMYKRALETTKMFDYKYLVRKMEEAIKMIEGQYRLNDERYQIQNDKTE